MFNFIKKYISENTGILIRLDDIAENMNWPLMEKCELLFDKYRCPIFIPDKLDGRYSILHDGADNIYRPSS